MGALVGMLIMGECFAQQIWSNIGAMPYRVAGAKAFSVGDSVIYVFGGYSDSTFSAVNWIQEYSLKTGKWKIIDSMKTPRYLLNADIDGDTVYYFGGIQDDSPFVNKIERWHRNTGASVYDSNFYFNRIYSTGGILNGRYYVFGGFTGGGIPTPKVFPYIVEYDIRSKSIVYKDTVTFALNSPVQQILAKVGGSFFLYGGVFIGVSNVVYEYIPQTHLLISRTPVLIKPRAGGEAVYMTQSSPYKLYIIGGYDENRGVLSHVEAHQFIGLSYTTASDPSLSLNVARKDFMAIPVKNQVYIFGGMTSQGDVIPTIEKTTFPPVSVVTNSVPPTLKDYALLNNYPNPFNASTKFQIDIRKKSIVRVELVSTLGQVVKRCVDQQLDPGRYLLEWDGTDSSGKNMPSGIYFIRMSSDRFQESKKIILLR
jgi:hypothetical protein